MKKKRLILILLCLLVILGYIGWKVLSDYSLALEANWGFSLPFKARYQLIYEKDSGPSFHGDGIRYHVYSYRYEDYIDLMFPWEGRERNTIYNKTYSEEVSQWLDRIEVPDQWRPDYDNGNCSYRYRRKEDNSQIIIVWNSTLNRLYIAESFI